MLRATDLGKRFGARAVFRGLSFAVESGAVVAAVGNNGAGKSTLLKIVAGLLRPTIGRVSWCDKSDSLLNVCGLAAPDAPLYRELSCLENLEFVARVRGLSRGRNALEAHLESFALRARRDDPAGDLSSGLRMRLQLAVAVLHAPPVLLLDEAAANLDAAGRDILKRVLDEQRLRGLAIVATNDAREAATCDARIVVESR